MVKQQIVPVDIHRETYNEISKIAEVKNMSLRKLVNEILELDVKKTSFLQTVAPKMSFVELTEDSLVIREKDSKKTRYCQITIHNESLWCDIDDIGDCKHIHYALLLPELANLKNKIKKI